MSKRDPPTINKLFPDEFFSPAIPGTPSSGIPATSKSKTSFAISGSLQESGQASFLETLSNKDLIEQVEEMRRRCKYLKLDNKVMQKFLAKNRPAVVHSMHNILKVGSTLQMEARKKLTHTSSSGLLKRTTSVVVRQSTEEEQDDLWKTDEEVVDPAELVTESSIKVNFGQKTDLVTREMEEVQADVDRLREWSYKNRTLLKAELEEMQEREKEIDHAIKWFEKSVLREGVDPLTQRITFEKYHKFFADWSRRAHKTMDKLRLRVSSLKVASQKVNALLIEKKLVGENVHAVDFENLEIQKSQIAEEIAFKTNLLFEVKTMQGDINLALSNVSKILNNKLDTVKKMEVEIEDKEAKIKNLDEEADRAAEELDKDREMYESKKQKLEEFKVPDIMDYVRLKAKLYDLKRQIEIWSARTKNKHLSLKVSLLDMKRKTGSKTINRGWVEPTKELLDKIQEKRMEKFEFQYEKNEMLASSSSLLLKARRRRMRSSERMLLFRRK